MKIVHKEFQKIIIINLRIKMMILPLILYLKINHKWLKIIVQYKIKSEKCIQNIKKESNQLL